MRTLFAAGLQILFAACTATAPWPLAERTLPPLESSESPTAAPAEAQVRQVIAAFYTSLDRHVSRDAPDLAADGWIHAHPTGPGVRDGAWRLHELPPARGGADAWEVIETVEVRFAAPEVAVATVTSRSTPFTALDGVRREGEQRIRSLVLVNRGTGWLLMHQRDAERTGRND